MSGRKYERRVMPKGRSKAGKAYVREEREDRVPESRHKLDLFLKERNRILLDTVTAATERPRQYDMDNDTEEQEELPIAGEQEELTIEGEPLLSDAEENEDPDSENED